MAKTKEATEAVHTEEMIARVNEGGKEVLLRGLDSAHNIVFHGVRGFKTGSRYTVSFTEIPAETYAPKPTTEEIAAARKTLEAAEVITPDERKNTDSA